MIGTIFEQLSNKRILILGFGKEGQSSLNFILQHQLGCGLGIADIHSVSPDLLPKSDTIELYTGKDYLEAVQHFDIILKSPGIKRSDIQLSGNQVLSSQTDLFLRAFHQQTIGITGTKGKSTTTSLIHHILQSAGKKCLITGNIGTPCFDSIAAIEAETLIVFELSAHQLEFISHSPHIAVLLNLFEEHLDHFGTKEAYFQSKTNIFAKGGRQDVLIAHESLSDITKDFQGKKQYFPIPDFPLPAYNPLQGEHNLLNIQAAVLCAAAAGLEFGESLAHVQTFRPLPHRLQFVGEFDSVQFYNDSIATIPEATILALKSLKKTDWLILGGFDRGIDYSILVKYLMQHPVSYILATGLAGKRISGQLLEHGYQHSIHPIENLDEAFDLMEKKGQPGDVCLLSPAAASYDQYKNFEHRGALFSALSRSFKRKPIR